MSMTDPIADLLTRIRNALIAKHRQVAADSDRILMGKEEEPVSAGQILDRVLVGREKQIDAGIVHQRVEMGGVKRQIHKRSSYIVGLENVPPSATLPHAVICMSVLK